MRPRTASWTCLLAGLVALAGCRHAPPRDPPRDPPPATEVGPRIDLNAPPGNNAPGKRLVHDLVHSHAEKADCPAPGSYQYRILALSGGAAYGAFTAGVLDGWTQSGQRPMFTTVTGVSVGGLIATFAFLGPAYDGLLREVFTTIDSSDVYRRRPTASILWSDSAASSDPLKNLIDSCIDERVVNEVARAHGQGRRLFVASTNLDHRGIVIWDLGAIASSGRPDRVALYRKIVLASASVPGFFPPVEFDVTVNGRRCQELHADGAATSQIFIPTATLRYDPDAIREGRKPLAGSEVYLIVAGKLFADAECVPRRVTAIAAAALASLTYAETRNDLIRIWTICRLAGMKYHLMAIPQAFDAPTDALDFSPESLRRMYAEGVRQGRRSDGWRTTPPGVEDGELPVPRSGTEFAAPTVTSGRQPW